MRQVSRQCWGATVGTAASLLRHFHANLQPLRSGNRSLSTLSFPSVEHDMIDANNLAEQNAKLAKLDDSLPLANPQPLRSHDGMLTKEMVKLEAMLTKRKAQLTLVEKQLDIVVRISMGETVPDTLFVQIFKSKVLEHQEAFIEKLKVEVEGLERIVCRIQGELEFLKFLESVGHRREGSTVIRLTKHPTAKMFGKDRENAVAKIVTREKVKDANCTKEDFPVYCVIAAPRQGKSRLLDEVAKKFCEISQGKPAREREIVVSITFDSASPLTAEDVSSISCNPSLATAHFWGRVVHSLLWTTDEVTYKSFDSIKKHSWFPFVNMAWAAEVATKIGHTNTTWIVMADELSKLFDAVSTPIVGGNIDAPKNASKVLSTITTVCHDGGVLVASGFRQIFEDVFASLSGRPIVSIKLLPTIFKNRHQYKELFAAVEEELNRRHIPFPWMTLELLKYSPGLVGFWLETLQRTDKAPVTTLSALNPPIVVDHSSPDNINAFFAAVDNQLRHGATASLDQTWTLAGNGEADALGLMLAAENKNDPNNYFLNPFFLFHETLNYDFPGKCEIVARLKAWEKAKHDHMTLEKGETSKPKQPSSNLRVAGTILNKAKGDVAEEIVASALAVRLVHTPTTKAMTLADLIARIGGHSVYHSEDSPSADASSRAVADGEFLSSKENAFVRLTTFPSMKGEPKVKGTRPSCQTMFESNVTAINGICGASVLRMSSEFNAGCDLGVIVNTARKNGKGCVVREKALFLYEVHRDAPLGALASHTNHPREVARKARLVLDGLLDVSHSKRNYLQRCHITRVVFVYCVPNTPVDFAECHDVCLRELRPLMKRYSEKRHRCDVSIHVVDSHDNDRLWKELLMNTFYYIFPDPDIDVTQGTRTDNSL